MELLNTSVTRFDTTVKGWLSFVDNNEYLSGALALFLIVYAAFAAPKLPESIARLFEYPLVKFLVIFLVAYSARKNPTVAIVATIALIVTLQVLHRFNINRAMMYMISRQEMKQEHMASMKKQEEQAHLMDDGVATEESMPHEALAELEAPCVKKANYRNSFYPQYVNMKPDAYMARYTGGDVNGYDPTADYQ